MDEQPHRMHFDTMAFGEEIAFIRSAAAECHTSSGQLIMNSFLVLVRDHPELLPEVHGEAKRRAPWYQDQYDLFVRNMQEAEDIMQEYRRDSGEREKQ